MSLLQLTLAYINVQLEIEETTTLVENNESIDTSPTIEPITQPLQNTEKETTPNVELPIEPTLDTTNIDADTGEVLDTISVTKPVLEELRSTQSVKQEPQKNFITTN